MRGDIITLTESQSLEIIESTTESLTVVSTWAAGPGKPPPRHFHPQQDERFEVLEGELTVAVGRGEPRALGAGDVIDIPRGTPHLMWNATSRPARATWRVTPGLRTEEMFRYIGDGLSPARVATMLWRFRDEYRPALPLLH